MFVPTFGFCLTEHDPERLWIVKGTEHRTVELEDGINVFAWAHERWPEPRWSVELDAWPLGRDWPRW